MYIVPAFPPLPNVNTTLLVRILLACGCMLLVSHTWATSHQRKLPGTPQDHGVARYAEEMEFAAQLLFFAHADHITLIPLIAQLLGCIAGGNIDELIDFRVGEKALFFGSVHDGCRGSRDLPGVERAPCDEAE